MCGSVQMDSVSADKYGALCMMYHIVTDATHDGSAKFAQTTCAHHNISSVLLLGHITHQFARLLGI